MKLATLINWTADLIVDSGSLLALKGQSADDEVVKDDGVGGLEGGGKLLGKRAELRRIIVTQAELAAGGEVADEDGDGGARDAHPAQGHEKGGLRRTAEEGGRGGRRA